MTALSAPVHAQFVEVDDGVIDPRGTWSCVLYGDPAFGDQRILLTFAPDQSTFVSRSESDASRPWSPLSRWRIEDNVLSFSDSRTGRNFEAELERPTLGGSWKTLTTLGGWWCTATNENVDLGIFPSERRESNRALSPLIPAVMATPRYPRQAIREAREGRVVICFEVDPSGQVQAPEFIELSDEIFRATSLDALMMSSYQPLTGSTRHTPRPACRSFIYRLDQIY